MTTESREKLTPRDVQKIVLAALLAVTLTGGSFTAGVLVANKQAGDITRDTAQAVVDANMASQANADSHICNAAQEHAALNQALGVLMRAIAGLESLIADIASTRSGLGDEVLLARKQTKRLQRRADALPTGIDPDVRVICARAEQERLDLNPRPTG